MDSNYEQKKVIKKKKVIRTKNVWALKYVINREISPMSHRTMLSEY